MTQALSFLRPALNLVLPQRCLSCDVIVGEPGGLCAECWDGIRFLSGPACAACGYPLEGFQEEGEERLCGVCAMRAPGFEKARSALVYDAASRPMILRFKHGDRTDMAKAFARWMMRAGAVTLDGAEVIVPAPLHRGRLLSRRFNQAALLARPIAQASGAAYAPLALQRVRATPSQGGLSGPARRKNVRGAFLVKRPEQIKGKVVVMVDDVYTTGATLSECARVLRKAGAVSVRALTLARVIMEESKEGDW